MLNKNELWILTAVATIALVLVLANMLLFNHNQNSQAEVNGRGQYIQQTLQLQNLYQEMVKALADLSVRTNDNQLRDLLTKQGISVTTTPAPAAAPATAQNKGGK